MRRLFIPVTGGVILALLAASATARQENHVSAPASQPIAADPLPATAALYQAYVAAKKMPGIVGAFGVGDQPTVYVSAGALSYDAGAAATGPDSLWRVYSMTKPITGIAAMLLIEDGKLSLDQPISDILPAFKNMTVRLNEDTLDARPVARPITVRHLLTHTSGLGYNILTMGPLLEQYNQKGITPLQINRPMEIAARKTRPVSLLEFADRVATLPLTSDPGTKWTYSMGLDVLGAVVEKAGGMPFDSFIQTRIFDPLKMTSSWWTVPKSEVGRFATNYMIYGESQLPMDAAATSIWLDPPSFPYGGSGLVMSARDYDRFLHMLQNYGELDGVRIMKAETAKLAMSDLLPARVEFSMPSRGADGPTGAKMGFGAGGFVVLEDKANPVSVGAYGWGGAAGTVAWVNPVNKLRSTIMVNYFPGEKWPIRDETLKALAADMAGYRAAP